MGFKLKFVGLLLVQRCVSERGRKRERERERERITSYLTLERKRDFT